MRDSYWRDPLLWILVALTFVIRIGYNLALHPDGHPPKTFVIDETEYFGAAHVLAEGRGFSFFDTALWVRPPIYVASLAAVMSVAGDGYVPALVFQSLVSALTLPALGWLAFRVGGRKAARWSLLLGLLYLPFTLFAGLLLSETLFLFLFAWSLVALLIAREKLLEGWNLSSVLALAGAGALLGLGVLTRSTALGFVPLAMLWLAWEKRVPVKRRVVAASGLLVVCLLTIAPWVARNYAAYGRFIPVDTTGGYNLWLGSVGVRDEPRLQADLLAIPDHAERQSFAYSQAIDNIAADPLGFAGKGLKESFDLWLPSFGAEERQVRGYALGRVPDWHLAALFLFDDLLYVLILLAAVLGLALAPPHPLKSLTALWVLLWVLMSFVFFAVTRFRLPIVACLIPWAGVGIAILPELRSRVAGASRGVQVAGALAMLAIIVVIVPALPLSDTRLGVERWGQQAPFRLAEEMLREGSAEEAIAQYERANTELSDTRYGLAAALIQVGRSEEALALLRPDEDPDRYEPHIIRGEAARKAGNLEDARSYFNARAVQVAGEEALDWAWDHLRPEPTSRIDIGSGLDLGYVRGFYGPETDAQGTIYRWATPRGEIRWFAPNSTSSITLTLALNSWRPPNTPPARTVVTDETDPVSENSSELVLWASFPDSMQSGQDIWSDVTLTGKGMPLSTTNIDFPRPIQTSVTSQPFVPGGEDPRLLGVRASTLRLDTRP